MVRKILIPIIAAFALAVPSTALAGNHRPCHPKRHHVKRHHHKRHHRRCRCRHHVRRHHRPPVRHHAAPAPVVKQSQTQAVTIKFTIVNNVYVVNNNNNSNTANSSSFSQGGQGGNSGGGDNNGGHGKKPCKPKHGHGHGGN